MHVRPKSWPVLWMSFWLVTMDTALTPGSLASSFLKMRTQMKMRTLSDHYQYAKQEKWCLCESASRLGNLVGLPQAMLCDQLWKKNSLNFAVQILEDLSRTHVFIPQEVMILHTMTILSVWEIMIMGCYTLGGFLAFWICRYLGNKSCETLAMHTTMDAGVISHNVKCNVVLLLHYERWSSVWTQVIFAQTQTQPKDCLAFGSTCSEIHFLIVL